MASSLTSLLDLCITDADLVPMIHINPDALVWRAHGTPLLLTVSPCDSSFQHLFSSFGSGLVVHDSLNIKYTFKTEKENIDLDEKGISFVLKHMKINKDEWIIIFINEYMKWWIVFYLPECIHAVM